MIRSLSVKDQSIETSGITKDYKEALCEYIWNGFEANASEIRITHTLNPLDGVESITISDNGSGICYDEIDDTFGAFLASRKNSLSLNFKSKLNKGKGRFSFISFASYAKWDTIYKDDKGFWQYIIRLSNENKEVFECIEPVPALQHCSGTTVTFWGINNLLKEKLSLNVLEDYLLKEYAWFLYLNKSKNVKILLNEEEVNYEKYIDTELSENIVQEIDNNTFDISLVVWNEQIKEKFLTYHFNGKGELQGSDTTTFNRNTVAFSHSVFIKSSLFDDWQKVYTNESGGQVALGEYESKQKTLRKLKKFIQGLISKKLNVYMIRKSDQAIQDMIEVRKTFPKFSNDVYGQFRKQDLVKVTKELYCLEPLIFYRLKDVQEKSLLGFLNLLLSSEERESILNIIEQIVELSSEQRKSFSEMLKKTRLENIIDTIKFIEERYKVIEILKSIVFDLANFANERNHIQKIIERHYWLFGEQYNLASADQSMQKALEQYLHILYGESLASPKIIADSESERRMDIFLCSSRKMQDSFETTLEENIVVELKSPKVILSKKVLRQIEDYMDFVLKQPQYNSKLRRWKFISVCKEVDNDVKNRYEAFKEKGKPGLVSQVDNYEVYALTWDDVFKGFDLRHSFMLDKLKYDRDNLSIELSNIGEEYKNRKHVDSLVELAVSL